MWQQKDADEKRASKERDDEKTQEDQMKKPNQFRRSVNMAKNWISSAIKRPGSLKKALGVKEGEKIPALKLKKAEHSKSSALRKKANLAETLKKMHKK